MSDYPELPESLKGTLSKEELDQLWVALLEEIADTEFAGRKHNNRRTYDAGCGGPMCRKAVREHARRRNSTNASNRYATIDAVLEYWFPHAVELVEWTRKNILSTLGK